MNLGLLLQRFHQIMFKAIETGIQGLIEIRPSIYSDNRGWFMESFRKTLFNEIGIKVDFDQDNLSFSNKGVLRGLHFQRSPFAQAKLVWVLQGSVIDAVVDLRQSSPTFGKSFKIHLDSREKNMLFIPEGFAHGFYALEDTLFQYKCSSEYKSGSESGIHWNDPMLQIDWGTTSPIISEKDSVLPTLQQLLDRGELMRQA